VPGFLPKRPLREQGVEDGVHVDVDEVVEILRVGAGDGVHRTVFGREGVQEGLQRALGELDERILGREAPRAPQHRVLHDVRYAGGIVRWRNERDPEAFVLVGVLQRQQLRSRSLVPIEARARRQFWNPLVAQQ